MTRNRRRRAIRQVDRYDQDLLRHDEREAAAADRDTPSVRFDVVPRISAFYGIIIAMYFDDHPPAHFHAKYGEYEAQVAIATGEILNGELPRRARALVEEWTKLHRDELMDDWARAVRQEPLRRIEPLP